MLDYYSPLLLPSNGLEYDSFIYIKELTVGSSMIHYDEFYANSEIGKIIAIINNHFKHKDITNIADMYYGDVIYVWNFLCSRSFNINEIKKTFVCKKCNKKKNISVHLKDLDIEYLKSKNINIDYNINNNFIISYRRRKMHDNINFSFFTLEDNIENIDYIYNYAKEQVICIKDIKNNKTFSKEMLKDLLLEVGITKTSTFFNHIREEDYGFKSDYVVVCDSCNQNNDIKLIDPLDISFFHKGIEINNEQYESFLETAMVVNSLKYISFSDFLNIPNSKIEKIIEIIKKLQEQKYSKNKGSYFDQVMEDM